ncbi:hypothetical protein P3S67_008457 [Capsicum chacoense]
MCYTITELIRGSLAMQQLSSMIGREDLSITFLAKRSDGKEMLVDNNKFLKMNYPLMLIDF